jgi:gas vesicle protein
MRDDTSTPRPGFNFGQLLLALIGGAAAGAAAAYLTAPRPGDETRRRLQAAADDTRDTVARVPLALRKATEAARDAFTEALSNGVPPG